MQTPLPARRPLARKLACAVAAPSARAGLFRGAVTASMVVSWRLVPRTPNRSPRPCPSPWRPARRALPLSLSGQPRPAGHGFQSLRSQALSSPSTQGLGLASAPAWGWRGPNRAPAAVHFGSTPTPALSVCFLLNGVRFFTLTFSLIKFARPAFSFHAIILGSVLSD